MIGRRHDDPAWPGVVWGAPAAHRTYDAKELARITRRLQEDFDDWA